jgi:hypothetical protein
MRRQARAQESRRSCSKKGGFEGILHLLAQPLNRRPNLFFWCTGDYETGVSIDGHNPDLAHGSVAGTGEYDRHLPQTILGYRESTW